MRRVGFGLARRHKRGTALAAVANQSATFGTLTIAQAGGFKPVDANADTRTLTAYNSLVSGSLGVYTPSIVSGALVFSGGAGAPDAAVLRCTHAGGTVDITIATVANTYSVNTKTESLAALSGIGVAGGKTIRYRRGNYGSMDDLGKFVSYLAEVVHLGEGTADTGKGTRWATAYTTFSQNQAFENLEAYTTNTTSPLSFNVFPTGLRITDCYLHGIYHNPLADWSTGYTLASAAVEVGGTVGGFVVERCLMEYVVNGILATTKGTMTIQDNEIRFIHSDGMQISADPLDKTSARIIRRNVVYGTLYDEVAHSDFIQLGTTNAPDTDEYANWTIEQNVCFSSTTVSLGTMQGIWTGVVGTGNGMRFKDPIVRYNIILDLHANSMIFYNLNGGTFTGNLVAHMDTVTEAANTMSISLGVGGTSIGAISVTNNVTEGKNLVAGPTYTDTNNIILGNAGSIISFTSAFNDSAPATGFTNYANALAKRTAKAGGPIAIALAGPLGVGVATFGSPRIPAGWSIP